MMEYNNAAEALAVYRRIQNSEGATMADEMAMASAMGKAWRAYILLCCREGIEPESMDNPNLGVRY